MGLSKGKARGISAAPPACGRRIASAQRYGACMGWAIHVCMEKTMQVVSEYSLSYAEPMSERARPLPPAERRAALVAATLPLISEHGPAVSTRQIAVAAGVAEG